MTILDLILSISSQRVMIANDFKVCVCVQCIVPYYVQAKIKSISSDTHALHTLQ